MALLDIRNDSLRFQDTSTAPLPFGIVPCLLCVKPFMMPPFVGTPDQVCPECFSTYRETARVICRHCKLTIGRVVPKLLDNGFYIRPKAVLHSDSCNCCRPGLEQSEIIEIAEWQRHVRQPKIIVTR